MEPAQEPIECINAVTVVVSDMATSVAFYVALGFRLHHGGPDAPFSSLEAGSGHVNLQLGSYAAGEIWGRVVFWVGDVDAMHQRALAAGLDPATPPTDAAWGERYFHIRDPDGHELSFARPLPG